MEYLIIPVDDIKKRIEFLHQVIGTTSVQAHSTPIKRTIEELNGILSVYPSLDIIKQINNFWRFDNEQYSLSNWHEKQDLIELLTSKLKELE